MILSDLLIFPALLYGFYLLRKTFLWRNGLSNFRENELPQFYSGMVSIILPVRNEEENIRNTIQQILSQSSDDIGFEVIVINDASTDDTKTIIDSFQTGPQLKVFHLKSKLGKKGAVSFGINNSMGDIIVTVDADSEYQASWLRTLIGPFQNPDVILVQGSVYVGSNSGFLNYFQFLESASLQIFTGADFSTGNPGLGNGANLAFRKNEFEKVGGYNSHKDIESGDDIFLISDFRNIEGKQIYNFNPLSSVATAPISSFNEIVDQKLRWAGKWKHYSHGKLKTQGLIIFISNLYFFLMLFLPLISNNISNYAIFPVLIFKGLFEGIAVNQYCSFVKEKMRPIEFLLLVLLYPIYAVFFGIASLFIKSKWK